MCARADGANIGPAVLVTFLFSDIEGSTELLRRLGPGYPAVLSRYEALVAEACERHGGTVVDSQGDSLFVAFPSGGGLNAAAEAQRSLADEAWPEGVTLRARMGVHSGEAEAVNGRYAGLAVHRAARIGSAAHGGQVLVSATTKELADDLELPHSFRDLGAFPLKDFERPVRLFQLSLDGLPAHFPPPRTGESKRERSRRRRLVLGGAALATLAAAALAFAVLRSDDPGGLPGLSASNSVGVIDPDSNTLVGEIPVGIRPTAITTGEGAVWVVNAGDGTVSKIDPATRAVTKTIPVDHLQDAVAAGEGGVWVVAYGERAGPSQGYPVEAVKISPEFGSEVARVPFDQGATLTPFFVEPIAVGGGWVWAGSQSRIVMIDSAAAVTRGVIEGVDSDAVAWGETGLWIVSSPPGLAEAPGALQRIDPATRASAVSIPIDADSNAVAVGAGSVWVVSRAGSLIRVDPVSNTVEATIAVGFGASGVAANDDGVWVANGGETTVMRVDPKTNKVVATIELGIRPDKIAVGEGAVWVTAY